MQTPPPETTGGRLASSRPPRVVVWTNSGTVPGKKAGDRAGGIPTTSALAYGEGSPAVNAAERKSFRTP